MSPRCRYEGFSLVEVVVAFAIASASLAVLFQIHAKAAATVSRAEEYLYATGLARSLIAQHSFADAVSSRTGTNGKYDWKVIVAPYDGPPGAVQKHDAEESLVLTEIRAIVSWSSNGTTRDFELRTLRLQEREQD